MSRALFCVLLTVQSFTAVAQEPAAASEDARLRALEEQNRVILDRLRASEDRNVSLETEMTRLRESHDDLVAERNDTSIETGVNALTERINEGVTFRDLTKSGNPIKFYGFIRFDAYYNTARMSSVIIPQFVFPENDVAAKDRNDDEFGLDARLTRFAFDVNAGKIGSADVMGKLETDFANFPAGVPESRETPRIRLAYINMKWGEWTVRLGQDWDTISPLYPAVNSELLMWNAGNLGDRRPQAAAIWNTGNPAGTAFELRAAAGLTGAVDNLDLDTALPAGVVRPFTSTAVDGFDSGHPNFELRLALSFPSWVDLARATIGVWGSFAGLQTDTRLNGENHFTSWLAGIDWNLPLFGPLSFRGEAWLGDALADFRGGIGQSVNTITGKEISSAGGWAEFVWQCCEEFKLSGGATIDDVDNGDIANGSRELNGSFYIASTYAWGGGLKSGLDFIFWETQWENTGIGNAVRINFYTQLDF